MDTTTHCPTTGKFMFKNPQDAWKVNKRAPAAPPYRCAWCNHYHVASVSPIRTKKRKHNVDSENRKRFKYIHHE
jgi:hypothetical protein